MSVFDYYFCAPAIIVLSILSIIAVLVITYRFFGDEVDSLLNMPSVAFILCCLPKIRIRLFILTAILIASATFTAIAVICGMFIYKEEVMFECMAVSGSINYALLIWYVHTLKKYEIMASEAIYEG